MNLMVDKIRIALCFVFLLGEAISDRKRRKIVIFPVGLFFSAGIILSILQGKEDFLYAIAGSVLGGLVLLFSYLSKEQIGYGDGLVLIAAGALLGVRMNLFMFLFGLFFAALKGIWLMMTKKANRKTKMAFVPFLLPGLMLSVMLTMSA
ncbi:MAG: prepilin peptidase [Lachnospiraceae bacterium]|nr:prepilin peptidase [Lachnospiraceae bacterium]MBR3636708.1 prepilin peptidase [Lachnospiraceae bacterium]